MKSTPAVTRVKHPAHKLGYSPGAIVYVGETREHTARVKMVDYGPDHFRVSEMRVPEDTAPTTDPATVTWLDITGIHDVSLIESLGLTFNIHPLVLEDITNTHHRPKIEYLNKYIFLVLKMITFDAATRRLGVEQISLILGEHYLLTFRENDASLFQPVMDRLQNARGRLRRYGVDYLAYSIMDLVVDHYFLVLEEISTGIQILEENILEGTDPAQLREIHQTKKNLLALHRIMGPTREMISRLQRESEGLLSEQVMPFIGDLYDHILQIHDNLEIYNTMLLGISDLYYFTLSQKMNEVMKVLTIIATIFIPLSFIVGLYGMNFQYMPELKWPWGYPAVLGGIILVVLSMLCYFRRKKWL
ncbi:MAG: magnesium/cobalt transporter CorA [Acidobacteria bacterium]|nr:magnesium/cobalt transporter CorA [Acidobacteriota bacterium]